MIRVIYKWKVEKANIDKFNTAWGKATTTIRESTKGARGSFLLQNHDDPTLFLTIARWDSREEWQQLWNDKDTARKEMDDMHDLGERLSVEAYEELEDHTV